MKIPRIVMIERQMQTISRHPAQLIARWEASIPCGWQGIQWEWGQSFPWKSSHASLKELSTQEAWGDQRRDHQIWLGSWNFMVTWTTCSYLIVAIKRVFDLFQRCSQSQCEVNYHGSWREGLPHNENKVKVTKDEGESLRHGHGRTQFPMLSCLFTTCCCSSCACQGEARWSCDGGYVEQLH